MDKINLVDVFIFPELLTNYLKQIVEGSKIICLQCHSFLSLKFEKGRLSHLCKCGWGALYQTHANGEMVYKFISKEKYDPNFKGGENAEKK